MAKFAFSFLVSLIFLTACSPRDTKVLSPEQSAYFNGKKAGKNSNSGSNGNPNSQGPTQDDMILATHLVERQAEALQMLSWVFKTETFNPNKDSAKQVVVSATKADQQTIHFLFDDYKQNYLQYKTTLNGAIQADVSFVPGTQEIAKIEITSSEFATFVQVNGGRDGLQAFDTRHLTFAPAADTANEFDVVYWADTDLAISKGGSNQRSIKPLVVLRLRMEDATKNLEILTSKGSLRNYDRYMKQNISSSDLKVTLDGCAKIIGTVEVLGKGKGVLTVSEESFSSDKWSSTNAACEIRPVLDWRRFLE